MVKLHDKTFAPYLSEQEIDSIIIELANKINREYKDKQPLLLGVLNGSFMFISDLMKKLTIDCELSFIKLSSYSGTKSQGVVDEVIGLSTSLTNKDVIVLEDNGYFSNRMIFQTPSEALDIIKETNLRLDTIDIHKRELTVSLTGGDLWFIKFNDLITDETFSLV